ncbi:hypothetical protein H310_07063 [Aphanomyces invadans]|uniref:MYND-type domain-containing protein n=1 Tax=Aphanomyces invadans TaxID=157072 RepID=A0A024U4C4_9STRA|nr:hypothetical protein H310_07063 [Aphanomyces invadans]ETW00433.1 hypothetical protein H310_07063 [Aphanomyces invadans]|eukprot:XP_008870568.1 hypothetical protein H310_07063 [Aphanomyces invadans]
MAKPRTACSNAASCNQVQAWCRRCVRCKSQAYCSKECQIQAWPSHRAACANMTCVQKWRELETRWWRGVPHETTQAMIENGLNPSSMAFYGEVYFTLTGLKPCVMLTGIPLAWRSSFLQSVIECSGVLGLKSLSLVTVGPVSTMSFAFAGTIALVNTNHPLASEIVTAVSTEMPLRLTETAVARWLDYPVALDTCTDSMVEVGYFDSTTNQLVTSYCASLRDRGHQRQIQDHFERYAETLGSMMLLRREAVLV